MKCDWWKITGNSLLLPNADSGESSHVDTKLRCSRVIGITPKCVPNQDLGVQIWNSTQKTTVYCVRQSEPTPEATPSEPHATRAFTLRAPPAEHSPSEPHATRAHATPSEPHAPRARATPQSPTSREFTPEPNTRGAYATRGAPHIISPSI